ncbi:phospholipase A2 [Agilicoccus flavus]|uniref:phospholipase A2 n=1 Tax=Agilicoccus flavus TaxID=2775968 RepID=UPI001CF6C05E
MPAGAQRSALGPADDRRSWSHNGCSSPWFTKPATWAYDAWFNDACIRHDFGYRNYGPRSYLRLAPTETYREKIDDLFYRDMSHKNASVPSANRPALSVAALTFFKMVRWYGASAF